jgi:hypothetical protein
MSPINEPDNCGALAHTLKPTKSELTSGCEVGEQYPSNTSITWESNPSDAGEVRALHVNRSWLTLKEVGTELGITKQESKQLCSIMKDELRSRGVLGTMDRFKRFDFQNRRTSADPKLTAFADAVDVVKGTLLLIKLRDPHWQISDKLDTLLWSQALLVNRNKKRAIQFQQGRKATIKSSV